MKALPLLLTLVAATLARANYLSYIDEKGTKHIVESETEIPEKFRANFKVTSMGDPKNSVNRPAAPSYNNDDPSLSPRASCENKVKRDAEAMRRKLSEPDHQVTPDERNFMEENQKSRDAAMNACARLSPDLPAPAGAPISAPTNSPANLPVGGYGGGQTGNPVGNQGAPPSQVPRPPPSTSPFGR